MTGYGEWVGERVTTEVTRDFMRRAMRSEALVEQYAAALDRIRSRWPSEEWGRIADDALDPPSVGDVLDAAWARSDAAASHGKLPRVSAHRKGPSHA